jgi:hypothetical protein
MIHSRSSLKMRVILSARSAVAGAALWEDLDGFLLGRKVGGRKGHGL